MGSLGALLQTQRVEADYELGDTPDWTLDNVKNRGKSLIEAIDAAKTELAEQDFVARNKIEA